MSNYVKSTDFASKDNLSSGDPLKIVKGTEIDTEFNNIATAVATKADTASPTISSATLTSPTLSSAVLGTPSSGTLTNCTGLPISTGVSGLGTGVATALAVNVGSAGAPVLFNGALGTPSSGDLTNCTFPTVTNATNAANLVTSNFTIEESGGKLIFKYGGTIIASMTSAGVFTALAEITSNTTP